MESFARMMANNVGPDKAANREEATDVSLFKQSPDRLRVSRASFRVILKPTTNSRSIFRLNICYSTRSMLSLRRLVVCSLDSV